MLFNSWPFVALVVTTALIYFTVIRGQTQQIYLLIFASFVFYGYGQLALLTLLVASILVNALASYAVRESTSIPVARAWAFFGVVVNLTILVAFKYGGFLANTLLLDGPQSQHGIGAWLINLPLPIGISFYTFQGISLLVDTLTGDLNKDEAAAPNSANRQASFVEHTRNVFFFISFFPQLVAGPVLKAKQFLPQIRTKSWQDIDRSFVIHCLITGYFLKMVIADNLKDQTFWIQFPYFQWLGSVDLLVMLFGYSAQIYADFAGYSLIAIGVSALFGYRLPKNFDFPYISTSVTEFWRRWHISLSSWLREYLYIPLGGNQRGSFRTYLNLLIVMFLGGLWHGAAWSFAIWGLWHGLGLAIERVVSNRYASAPQTSATTGLLISLLKWAATFAFVSFGWLLFKLTEIGDATLYLVSVARNTAIAPSPSLVVIVFMLTAPVAIYHALYLLQPKNSQQIAVVTPGLYGLMLFLIAFNSGTSAPFVYFQF